MGICKCKNTTDLYCFTHRCHVCEHCIVDENGDHRHCYVRKYTDYVNNSVFAPPVCGFCNKLETEGDASRTVRLPCYDIVHLTCLDAAGVAATTAQAPVKCPLCGADVFPKGASRASPVMDALCTALKDSLWASPLVEAVPKVVTTAAAATTTTVPHAKSPVPKAIEVPIPPVSDATIVPPPPPSSPSSLTDIAQVQLNATKEVDVPVNVLDVGNSGSSGMLSRKNVGGSRGEYSVTDVIERAELGEEDDEVKYHNHTCSQILYYFGVMRESNGKVSVDYTKVFLVFTIVAALFYLVSLASKPETTEGTNTGAEAN